MTISFYGRGGQCIAALFGSEAEIHAEARKTALGLVNRGAHVVAVEYTDGGRVLRRCGLAEVVQAGAAG